LRLEAVIRGRLGLTFLAFFFLSHGVKLDDFHIGGGSGRITSCMCGGCGSAVVHHRHLHHHHLICTQRSRSGIVGGTGSTGMVSRHWIEGTPQTTNHTAHCTAQRRVLRVRVRVLLLLLMLSLLLVRLHLLTMWLLCILLRFS
jgi:hypothetical protein